MIARPSPRRRELDLDDYEAGVLAGDRTILARAITLVESSRDEHRKKAQELLVRLLPRTGGAHRVGITGIPGVGKSTFIEALGTRLADAGHHLAVLAVDPSSTVSGGSILGDKTRMSGLATHARAFVRPSPSGRTLGGVARKTRETLLLCEAAGYDIVLVETVGVGQAEVAVAEMVDFVVLLLLSGAGDELQGVKRGILEWVDLVAFNKADGDGKARARQARAQYETAMRFVRPQSSHWTPPITCVSAKEGDGLDEVWTLIEQHRRQLGGVGEVEERRSRQQRRWMWSLIEDELLRGFRLDPRVAQSLPELEDDVVAGRLTPTLAAERLLKAHGHARSPVDPPRRIDYPESTEQTKK